MDIFSLGSAEALRECQDFDGALYTDLQICDSPNLNDRRRELWYGAGSSYARAVISRNAFCALTYSIS